MLVWNLFIYFLFIYTPFNQSLINGPSILVKITVVCLGASSINNRCPHSLTDGSALLEWRLFRPKKKMTIGKKANNTTVTWPFLKAKLRRCQFARFFHKYLPIDNKI